MLNQDYKVYKDIMSARPNISKEYLGCILHLSGSQTIELVEIVKIVESTTALVIKASVNIQDADVRYKKDLFIKTFKHNRPEDSFPDLSIKEVKFYKFIQGQTRTNLPVPVCYDAFVSEETGEFVIVLEDISSKYKAPDSTSLQDKGTWFSCAECLAQLHSAFWNHKNIDTTDMPVESEKELELVAESDRDCLREFLQRFGDKFDDETKRVLIHAMEVNNALIKEARQRIIAKNNITIVNGDSHIYNFMLPAERASIPLLTDFQFWHKGIGTGDLAHLTRLDFSDDFKKVLQIPLVEHYYKSLLAHGVTDYSWENCINDYRTSIASMVLIPLWQYSTFNMKYEEWMGSVKGLVDNYQYLDCDELYRKL